VSRRSPALLLCLSATWGSSFVFIRLGVDELELAVVSLGRLPALPERPPARGARE